MKIMAMKWYSRLPWFPELELHYQIQFSVIPRIPLSPLDRVSYPCIENTISVFTQICDIYNDIVLIFLSNMFCFFYNFYNETIKTIIHWWTLYSMDLMIGSAANGMQDIEKYDPRKFFGCYQIYSFVLLHVIFYNDLIFLKNSNSLNDYYWAIIRWLFWPSFLEDVNFIIAALST